MTKHKYEPNGINWMLTDTWTKAQAAQRLAAQTKVTASVNNEEQDKDTWQKFTESTGLSESAEAATKLSIKPVPTFNDIVRQQEKAGT